MEEATGLLKNKIRKNPKLASKFTEEQIDAINRGKAKIPGYTWHHNEKEGVMQLVDERTHALTPHTGGYSLWGVE